MQSMACFRVRPGVSAFRTGMGVVKIGGEFERKTRLLGLANFLIALSTGVGTLGAFGLCQHGIIVPPTDTTASPLTRLPTNYQNTHTARLNPRKVLA